MLRLLTLGSLLLVACGDDDDAPAVDAATADASAPDGGGDGLDCSEFAGCGGDMHTDRGERHARRQRQGQEAGGQRQRQPVGNGHGEEVARGGESHQRREQSEPDHVDRRHLNIL